MNGLCYFQHRNTLMRQMKQFVQVFYLSRWTVSAAAGTIPCKDVGDLGGQHQKFCLGQRILDKWMVFNELGRT